MRSEYQQLAEELEAACGSHARAFRSEGYGAAVMAANDRIEAVHMRYAGLSGNWWRHGNDSLRVELIRLALIEAEEANGPPV